MSRMDMTGLSAAHRRLLLLLIQQGPLRRRELGALMDLSPGSITRLTKPLEGRGLVVATSEQVNATGRPVHRLEAALPAETIVGVSLSGEALRVVRTDLRGRTLGVAAGVLDSAEPTSVVARIGDLVEGLTGEQPDSRTVGLGVGVSGIVRGGRDVVRSLHLGDRLVPLGRMLEERLGISCVVANDVAAVALDEAWFGVGRDAGSFLVVTVGEGVGGAAVFRGVVPDAEAHGIGLLGHLPVAGPDGRMVRAGQTLTDVALLRRAASAGSAATTAAEVAAGLDAAAVTACREFAWACGSLVATGAAFVVPDAVVLLGERAGVVAAYRADFDEGVASAREGVAPPLAVTIRAHDRDVWAHGAAVAALVAHVSRP